MEILHNFPSYESVTKTHKTVKPIIPIRVLSRNVNCKITVKKLSEMIDGETTLMLSTRHERGFWDAVKQAFQTFFQA